MTTLEGLKSKGHDADDGIRAHPSCQADVEREVLALLRRLDEEDQFGALLLLQAMVRRVSMSGGAAPGR